MDSPVSQVSTQLASELPGELDQVVSMTKIVELRPLATKYAVLIPVLNQGHTLLPQLERMQAAGCPADVILSDGGSQDGSTEPELLTQLGVRSLLVTDERGLGSALRHGVAYALQQGYQGVITIDGNGKDGVEAIPRFVKLLDEGLDLVQGSRFVAGGTSDNTPMDRYLGIRWCIVPLIRVASGFRYTDPTNGFKGLSRALLRDSRMGVLRTELSGFNFQFYLNYRAPMLGFKVVEVPVARVYPKLGPTPTKIVGLRSRVNLLVEFLKTILGFYNPPRR
jgi:dolichol-phosphate mannosyltransferase